MLAAQWHEVSQLLGSQPLVRSVWNIGTTLEHYARFLPDVEVRNLGLLNSYFQTEDVSELGHEDDAR